MTSNMEEILKYFSEIDTEIDINTKSCWNRLDKSFKIIFKEFENGNWKKKLSINDKPIEQRGEEANTKVSFVKLKNPKDKVRFWRTEEALERLICIFNDKKCFNQFRIDDSSSKELVDLVYPNKKPHTFIELKPWNSKNSPLFGVIELLKNYYIYKDRENINELIFLAPKEYFKSYENKMDIFLKFVERLNKEFLKEKVELKIQYIDFKKDTYEKFIEKLSKENFEWIQCSSKTKSLEKKVVVDLKNYKECFKKCLNPNESLESVFEFKEYKDN